MTHIPSLHLSTSLLSRIPAYVRDFEPYRPIRPDQELMRFYGLSQLHRLHNNENLLGPPPAALEAIARFDGHEAALYPSGDAYYLCRALAARFDKTPDQFLPGNGSCEIIPNLVRAFCEPGDNIVAPEKTFAVYEWSGLCAGVEVRLAALHDAFNGADVLTLLDAVDHRTKLLFLCNPNNPTGASWPRDALVRLLDGLAGRCIVVLDEAYAEYVEDPDYVTGLDLMESSPHVLVLRTFSKIYGLSGLRVGYACAAAGLLDVARRTSLVYSVNRLAQAAAVAALEDDSGHLQRSRDMVSAAKVALRRRLDNLGLEYLCGQGNFMMLRAPLPDTLLARRLLARGFLVRAMTEFRSPNWVRVAMAPAAIMDSFVDALEEIVITLSR